MNYKTYSNYNTQRTPQSEPIPGSAQVANSAGGYSFALDNWGRLDRFLVLGTEGGTYYIGQQTLTKENATAALACIKEDGVRVVERLTEISQAGRAPKNDPALFVLAMCAGLGDFPTKDAAFKALPKVARIGTHLFHFAIYVEQFRGWGRGLRSGIASWYTGMNEDNLAYQAIKYQQRDGWSHRDLLRKTHPVPANAIQGGVFNWITQGWNDEHYQKAFDILQTGEAEEAMKKIWAFERAKRAKTADEIAYLIEEYRLPREAIPTEFLNEKDVWSALLDSMPITAMVRNLGKMTSLIGLLHEGTADNAKVIKLLHNQEAIERSRIHPLAVLGAMQTYKMGHGFRGKLAWNPVANIVDALDHAFYASFGNVTSTNKRIMLALDVSSSMRSPDIAGMPGVTPRIGSAAMALVTKRVEPLATFVAFASKGAGLWTPKGENKPRYGHYLDRAIAPIAISPRQRLDDVCKTMGDMPFGGTDCALPMMYALENGFEIDAFVVMTDSETWAGGIHPSQALRVYREKTGIPAKLIICGMTSNGFSVADPNDAGSIDVVGFDTATPNLISDFIV